eukprot:5398742-Alexandrium_andersonii.AAC.1
MSASLVGSEMCIRDSYLSNYLSVDLSIDRSNPGTTPGQPLDNPGTSPVSYTHLTLPTICSV